MQHLWGYEKISEYSLVLTLDYIKNKVFKLMQTKYKNTDSVGFYMIFVLHSKMNNIFKIKYLPKLEWKPLT